MLTYENILKEKGFENIAGVDEVGRGSLAGPLVAAAVVLDTEKAKYLPIKDSKTLTHKKREELYLQIMNAAFDISIKCVSSWTIDKQGLTYANKTALRESARGLINKTPDYVICDAFAVEDMPAPTLGLIKGDNVSISVAAASIIAKVTRDRMMQRYHRMYPNYFFDSNKGYSSKAHWESLRSHGPCPIHRRSFKGII